jgi:pilus assembly protein Flp/PilA
LFTCLDYCGLQLHRIRITLMKLRLQRFLKCNSAATAIEYGLIAGLIGVVIIGALTTTGTRVKTKFTAVGSALN